MKTLLLPVTATMAVLLIVLTMFLLRQNRVNDEMRQHIERERSILAEHRADLQRTDQARVQELQAAKDTIAQLQRELAVARAAAGLETDRERNDQDPAVQEFRRRQQRRVVQERYGDLFHRLSLSPNSLEELKRLLMELEEPASSDTGRSDEDASTGQEAKPRRSWSEIHDNIYHLLGYEDYMTFDRYGRELTSTRPMVRRFANDAADAGHPLTSVQRIALSRVIFEATDPQTNANAVSPGANTPNPTTNLTPLEELVLARATEVLASAQLELLRAFLIEERTGLSAWRSSLAPPTTAPVSP